ncbi:MAG TPA: hypothetical protein VF621_16365 [Pyrinomonadaceae bacterium]
MGEGERSEPGREEFGDESGRGDERGDVAEPDAPTAAEPNEGMSTILSADQPLGVQDDAPDV